MKIAFIYDCIYPYVKGGAEKRYYEISQRLKENHEIHFLGMKGWPGDSIIEKDGIYYHGVCKQLELYKNNRRSTWQPIYFSIMLMLHLFKYRFDIIDCSAFPYFSVFPTYLYSKLKKVPLVITWHEYWGKYWHDYIGIAGFIGRIIEKLALTLSPKIISVSKLTKQKLVEANYNEKDITVIPNGINLNKISNSQPASSPIDAIYTGRLIKEKNIDILIKAIKLLIEGGSSITCLIIGNGPEKQKLLDYVNQNQLQNNVFFKSFLQDELKLYSYMKSAKIFVLPSIREGFGIVALEANACGLPVITTNHPDNAAKELIRNNENGFTVTLSAENIAKIIKQSLSNDDLLNRMKRSSYNNAKQYSWKTIIKQINEYYQDQSKKQI